jgi:hypothetical protein
MNLQDEQLLNSEAEHSDNQAKPQAHRVDDDKAVEEKDLKRSYIFGDGFNKDANAPGMEGEGAGGGDFGKSSTPPTGNDRANPSQNAGNTNARLGLTHPFEEHTENNNFKDQNQQGEPDYEKAQPAKPKIAPPNNGEEQNAGKEGNTSEPGKANYPDEFGDKGPDYGSNSPESAG